MSFKNIALAAAVATAGIAASPAMAQSMPEQGWYAGASFGQMEAEGSCPSGFTCELKDSSWKLFGGYRINRNFAVEAFYANWGEISVRTGPVTATGEVTSFGAAGLAILPLGQLELFGKLGLANSKHEFTGSAPGFSETDSDSGSDLVFGLGATYNLTHNLGVRAEWERLNDSEVDIMSIGLQYRF